MARKNMSRRRRETNRSRSRSHTHRRRHRASSRNRSRRHRASSRRRRSRKAGVSYSEELGELEYLLKNADRLAHISEEDPIPQVLRIASINDRTKRNIDRCCDNCRENNPSSRCYNHCVQSEIDRVKQVMARDERDDAQDKIEKFLEKRIPKIIEISKRRKDRVNTLQKAEYRYSKDNKREPLPVDIGRKVAEYINKYKIDLN